MKGDDADTTVLVQELRDERERVFDLAEFVIYYNADGLENLGGRMMAEITVNSRSDKIGELLGSLDGAMMDDNSSKHSSCTFFLFTVFHKYLCQLSFAIMIDNICCCQTAGTIIMRLAAGGKWRRTRLA